MKKLTGVGINVYINHFDTQSLESLLSSLKLLRIKWIRLEVCSEKYSSVDKLRFLGEFARKCVQEGIVVVGLISDFIPLTYQSVFHPEKKYRSVFDRKKSLGEFIKKVVHEVYPFISHWEIWNEQNTKRFWVRDPSPLEYMTFLREISSTIRSLQKNATIIFGGIFGNDLKPIYSFIPNSVIYRKGFIEACLQDGMSEIVDHVAFHPYTRKCYFSIASPQSIAQSIKDSIHLMREKYHDLPLIISEIGVSPILNPRMTAAGIAQVYKDVIDYCEKIDLPVCIYALSDQHEKHYGIVNPDRDFGFIDYHLKPKELLEEYLKLL